MKVVLAGLALVGCASVGAGGLEMPKPEGNVLGVYPFPCGVVGEDRDTNGIPQDGGEQKVFTVDGKTVAVIYYTEGEYGKFREAYVYEGGKVSKYTDVELFVRAGYRNPCDLVKPGA